MSEVDHPAMNEGDARRLTERIRITAHNYAEAKAQLIALVQEAKEGRAHEALGYASWQAYLSDTLGDEPMRLARDERREMVQVLTAEGMSTRAIAPIVGVHHDTVYRDQKSSVGNQTVAAPRVSHGLDGKTRTHNPRTDTKDNEEMDDLPMPLPRDRPGLRRSHAKRDHNRIITNLTDALAGHSIAAEDILATGLDNTLTQEEASAASADLSRYIRTFQKLNRALKNHQEN